MFYAYILKSQTTGRYYYGSTKSLEERLKYHNRGKVRSTKGGKPWELHYSEEFETRSEAYKREHFFKSIEGYNWLRDLGWLKLRQSTTVFPLTAC